MLPELLLKNKSPSISETLIKNTATQHNGFCTDTHRLVEGPPWGRGDPFGSISNPPLPVSIKSLVSHSEISCLLSQTLWRGVNPSQLHLTQKPHAKHPHSCLCVSVGAHVACVITFLFAVSMFVHHVGTWESQTNQIVYCTVLPTWRTSGRANGKHSALPPHTERHLVQAYCTDNQNVMPSSRSSAPGNCIALTQKDA